VRSLSHHVERPISPLYDGLSQEALQALLALRRVRSGASSKCASPSSLTPRALDPPEPCAFWESCDGGSSGST
jgi:hypothetical protein